MRFSVDTLLKKLSDSKRDADCISGFNISYHDIEKHFIKLFRFIPTGIRN